MAQQCSSDLAGGCGVLQMRFGPMCLQAGWWSGYPLQYWCSGCGACCLVWVCVFEAYLQTSVPVGWVIVVAVLLGCFRQNMDKQVFIIIIMLLC